MNLIRLIVKVVLVLFISTVLFTIGTNVWVISSSQKQVFHDIAELPSKDVALVLGTSKNVVGGNPNPFFENRMDAAAELYKQGKTKQFLLSGDNRTKYYNEPLDMKKALVKRGVPESAITLDYAGLRTFDSIYRCHQIFGQESFIIVTQEFHSYRAVFISNYYGLNTVAYTAANVAVYQSTKVNIREFFARPKAIIDIYLLKKVPSILGPKEELTYNQD